MLDAQQPDGGQVRLGDFLLRVFQDGVAGEAVERHLHVGLTGGHPDVADQDVRERDGRA